MITVKKKKLKIGKVRQIFGNGKLSKIYEIKNLPLDCGEGTYHEYWHNRVWLYNLDGTHSHVAHINTLENI